MIKKLLKLVLAAGLLLVVLAVAAFFTLKKMYPPQKLKTMAQEYIAQNFQREVRFEDISFTWIGFTLTDFAFSEQATFAQGTFVKADKLTAHVAVKPLLKKRIEISTIEADGLDINIITQKDGTFNFDTLLPQQTDETATQETQSAAQTDEQTPLVITAQQIKLVHCDLIYKNEQTGMRAALNDLNIQIDHFDVNKPFTSTVSFTTDISSADQPDMSLPVTLTVETFLAGLDLPQAYAKLTEAKAQYKTVTFTLNGDIQNFEKPAVNLTGKLTGITNKVLADFAPGLPNFTLPAIHMVLQAQADLDNYQAQLTQAKLTVQDSALSAHGTIGWGGETPTYQLTGSLTALIGQLVQMTDTLDDFRPAGTMRASFKATEKKEYTDVSGTLTLQDVSVWYDPFTLTNLNGQIVLASLDNISSSALTGKLNGEKFTSSFSYKVLKNITDIVLNLNLDKLVLTKFPSSTEDTVAASTPSIPTAATSDTTDTTAMNVQATVKVGGIEMPYFQSNGLDLNAKLTNITDSMAHTNGTVNFTLQPGKITNLDDFIKDSKIAKILLLPVTVIKKVAGFLKLDLFPTTGQGTSISFTEGAGNYTFTDGVMNIDKTVFNSTVTNISASGTANFKTDALNMKATATLLTQAAPVSFKITGTMSDPKGKLDVVNTVTSVVGGILNGTAAKSAANGTTTVAKGAATTAVNTVKGTVNTAADVVKGIGSLFKKKTADE